MHISWVCLVGDVAYFPNGKFHYWGIYREYVSIFGEAITQVYPGDIDMASYNGIYIYIIYIPGDDMYYKMIRWDI